MADENEVERRQRFHPVDGGGVATTKLDLPLRKRPAPLGFGNGFGPEVDAEIETDVAGAHRVGERPGLVSPAACEIKHGERSRSLESDGGERIAQQLLQPPDIGGRVRVLKRELLDHVRGGISGCFVDQVDWGRPGLTGFRESQRCRPPLSDSPPILFRLYAIRQKPGDPKILLHPHEPAEMLALDIAEYQTPNNHVGFAVVDRRFLRRILPGRQPTLAAHGPF